MKIFTAIVRILMGLIFLASSIVVLFKLVPQPELEGGAKLFNQGMEASVYMMPMVKVIELICSIAFISGFYVPLASIVIFPITINIFLFHAFLAPEGMPVAIFLLLANIFLLYYHRKHYLPMLLPRSL